MIEFIKDKRYYDKTEYCPKDYIFIGNHKDLYVFYNDESDELERFSADYVKNFIEKPEPKEFKFNFYLHAGENWPLDNYEQCQENMTIEQLEECKYFCSEVKLGIKFSNGVFTLDSFSGIDVSDKNIVLHTI